MPSETLEGLVRALPGGEEAPEEASAAGAMVPGAGSKERVVRYYEEAGLDYGAWSKAFHMHFGYFRPGLNPLRLEPMLEEMCHQVAERLGLSEQSSGRVADLGCGVGSPARLLARHHPSWRVDGVTLVPWQVAKARRWVAEEGLAGRVRIHNADYTATPFADASFDGAWALESACHARGPAKEAFVREAARLLKPGARLVVVDGFLKDAEKISAPLAACLRVVGRCWALDTFADLGRFAAALERHGFEEIHVEDISWRIAPSVLHSPRVMLGFLLRQLTAGGPALSRERREHLLACALAPVLGLARWRFSYCIVSARRRGR